MSKLSSSSSSSSRSQAPTQLPSDDGFVNSFVNSCIYELDSDAEFEHNAKADPVDGPSNVTRNLEARQVAGRVNTRNAASK